MAWGWNGIGGVSVHSPMDFTCEPRLPAPMMAHGEIAVQAPPDIPKAVPANPLARLLPVAMMVAAVGMMTLYFTTGAAGTRSPMFMFFPVMMLMSVVGTLAYGARGSHRTAEVNDDRRDYLRYLDAVDRIVMEAAEKQHSTLAWSHPEPDTLWTLVGGQRMWERGPEDDDFCRVRVGLGDQRLSTALVAPHPASAEESDPVTTTALRRLLGNRSVVRNLPVTLALPPSVVISVDGDRSAVRALLRAMICQLAVFHSPENVKIAAVTDPEAAGEWDWLKWLPHHQHPRTVDAAGTARLVYRTLDEAEDALFRDGGASPYVVFICDGGLTTGVEQLLTAGSVGGATLLEVGARCAEKAGAHELRLRIDHDAMTVPADSDDKVLTRVDRLTLTEALQCARRLAAYRPAVTSTAGMRRTATTVEWLDLMGLDDPAAIDPSVLWHPERGRPRLRVPIGVSEHGAPVELDIKEAARNGMGPHGLCVGATGSGKPVPYLVHT
jgi:ESX secretion system protein EccC